MQEKLENGFSHKKRTFWLIQSKNCTQTPFFVIVNFLNRKKFCQFHYCDYSSVRLVALLLQHEAAMTSFGGTMAHLTHFGLLHNGGKSSLKEHNNTLGLKMIAQGGLFMK